MKTQQQLTDRCTPEIIKKMVELAEGFGIDDDGEFIEGVICPDGCEYEFEDIMKLDINVGLFPLLIHRAVEGWNRLNKAYIMTTDSFCYTTTNLHQSEERRDFKNYQPTTLTQAECAMLDCLIEVLK